MSKRKRPTKSASITALIKAATLGARQLEGLHATWLNVATKVDRSGAIITIVVGGEERAYVGMNRHQLDELMRLLESTRRELK